MAAGGICDRVCAGEVAGALGSAAAEFDWVQLGRVCGGVFGRGDEPGGCAAAGGQASGVDLGGERWGDAGGADERRGVEAAAGRGSVDSDHQWGATVCGGRSGGGAGGVGGRVGEAGGSEPESAERAGG